MSKLTFFRQARSDGGIRTGVEIDDTLLLHRFQEGSREDDPSIAWFVDVRFEGPQLPHEAEDARAFLLARRDVVASGLLQLADELKTTGIDADAWPLTRPLSDPEERVSAALVCSAIRRLDGREIAARLSDVAREWTMIIGELQAEAEWAR